MAKSILALGALLALAACTTAAPPAAPSAAVAPGPDAAAIHARAIVIDPHADVPSPSSPARAGRTDSIDTGTQIDFAKLQAGGVDAIFPSVFVSQGPRTPAGYAAARAEAEAKVAAIRGIVTAHPNDAVLALSADDIERAVANHKVAIMLSMLNAYPLGRDPEALRYFYAQGVRQFGLTHSGDNDFADSSRPHREDTIPRSHGLSPLGLRAIALANDLGILVDVSQLTDEGLVQAINASRAPVIASHSNMRAIVDAPRNLSDADLDLLAAHNGVVAVNAYSAWVRPQPPEELAALRAIWTRYGVTNNGEGERLPPAQRDAYNAEYRALVPRGTVQNLVDNIDYAVHRIGIDHVAISSDFNHGGGVTGWNDESEAGNVTAALVARGYSEADIDKLWGGNVLRVLRAAEQARRAP